jgi:hypothetical protein
MFGSLGLQAPLSHVAGAPLLSLGHGVAVEQEVVQTWKSGNGWQTPAVVIGSQSCSSRHLS